MSEAYQSIFETLECVYTWPWEIVDAARRQIAEERPIRVRVEGSLAAEMKRCLLQDRPPFRDWHPENYPCAFVDGASKADVDIKQISEPFLVAVGIGDSDEHYLAWEIKVKVEAPSLTLPKKQEQSYPLENMQMLFFPDKEITNSDLLNCLSSQLVKHMRQKGTTQTSISELYIESQQLDEDWGQFDLDNTMRHAICSAAKRKLVNAKVVHKPEAVTASEGWTGLRMMLSKALKQTVVRERDSLICSWFAVPPETRLTKRELKEYLEDKEIIPKMLDPNFNMVLKRKLLSLSPSALGEIGETWIYGLLTHKQGKQTNKTAVAHSFFRVSKPSGYCDISDEESCIATKAGFALNVKLSLEEYVNRSFELSPEHKAKTAYAVLVLPRLLQIRLYRITSENMVLNSQSRGLCVTEPKKLRETVLGLMNPI